MNSRTPLKPSTLNIRKTNLTAAASARTPVSLPAFRKIIWLMPAAYLLHIVEEYAGNFPAWVSEDVHGKFNYFGFDTNNIMFMIVLLTLVTLNFRKASTRTAIALTVFASANLFWDALFHLFMTPLLDRYSPGLVTAVLLYVPISLLVGIVVIKNRILRPRTFAIAVGGGAVLFGFVVWYGLFHFAV
ncbi:HXXEE domain-containing protein [Arthrobacter glacialis]|uniref:HXXEE domain-containing protein n=1 Tax=Arthrobacter glacialis TaxID=1664 RepID=A0A2S3ZUV4_ARTGL|nr:HXXEE domain-containing protein [Arthrobacter glacialis]POH58181.1 hypothetical protein CVS28_12060 [Arthrobacter glacialis]POH72884.1 hypothetical protein CVS27_13525 [Arthrobacter glacialis]